MTRKACKHLDYDEHYRGCKIRTCAPRFPDVRYWERGTMWSSGIADKFNPMKVQFCKLRGRVEWVFDCYCAPGPWECYNMKVTEELGDARDV